MMDSGVQEAQIKDKLGFVEKEGEIAWCPGKGACNGREMRRIMCVLERDGQRFKVLDVIEP